MTRKWIAVGIMAFAVCFFGTATSVNAEPTENLQYEDMKLLQAGDTVIPKHSYLFEENDAETLKLHLAANDGELASKQETAVNARRNGNVTLPERQEACAKVVYAAMIHLDKQIQVAEFALTRDEFKQVISDVVNSNPELFYIRNGYRIAKFTLPDEAGTEIVDYCQGFYEYQDENDNPNTAKIQELVGQLADKRAAILSSLVLTNMSDIEKALLIHDYIVLNTQYNYAAYLEYEQDRNESHFADSDYDIYGTLVNGKAVCQGYALTFKYLMEAAGIQNIGFASNSDHIWNTITIDAQNLFVDCTYDDVNWDTLGKVKHVYFLKGSAAFPNHGVYESDRVCNGNAYNTMFWDDVYSGFFYYRGYFYYMNQDGNLMRRKLHNKADFATAPVQVLRVNQTPDNSYNYMLGMKMTLVEDCVIFHDQTKLYSYNLQQEELRTILTPNLADDELIYGVANTNAGFQYATRIRNHTAQGVSYNDVEQTVHRWTLPRDIFKKDVQEVVLEGPTQMILLMRNGKLSCDDIYLEATIIPEDATDTRIRRWVSSNPEVATVDINGRVRAVGDGITTISAVAYDNGVTGTHVIKVIKTGDIIESDGKHVYYDNGTKITNRFFEINGVKYYFEADGTKAVGWRTIAGSQYYFDAKGKYVTGWQTIDGRVCYFDANGILQKGQINVEGKPYYFTDNGEKLIGWQKITGSQYYLGDDGVIRTGWQTISGNRYYFDATGVMQTGFQKIKDKKYYFDENGIMRTKWLTLAKKTYYLGTDGVLSTGFKKIKGKKYYFNKDGVMQTGFLKIQKKKYYFNKKGVMATGWKTIKGHKYYFGKNGVMYTGLKKVKGIPYYFDQKGRLIS